jgi:hypothetical protein
MIMRFLPLLLAVAFAPLGAQAQNTVIARLEQASDSEIQALLARFPAADANRDGTLTKEEAIAFAKAAMTGGGGKGKNASAGSGPAPTAADAAYGPHERNVLDFWKAEGEGPRPLVIFIHGGGFTGGDKSKWREGGEIPRLLTNGFSCAAIHYRFRKDAPIQEILRGAGSAVSPDEGRRMESRHDPLRRIRRIGRSRHLALARDPGRSRRSEGGGSRPARILAVAGRRPRRDAGDLRSHEMGEFPRTRRPGLVELAERGG